MVRDPGNPGQKLIPGRIVLALLVGVVLLAMVFNACGKG
jgi:hypothetical protein